MGRMAQEKHSGDQKNDRYNLVIGNHKADEIRTPILKLSKSESLFRL
jgi:hypothetical protein